MSLGLGAISYADGKRFARAVVAGARRVVQRRGALDEINVFPVPDHDTGSNLAATMRSLAEGGGAAAREKRLHVVADKCADAVLSDARGNSGAIVVEFICGFEESFSGTTKVDAAEFAKAARLAATRAAEAVESPREGTILTVMDRWADALEAPARETGDLAQVLAIGLDAAKTALDQTTSQLDVLGETGVVDAGALGFVYFLEGISDYIAGGELEEIVVDDSIDEIMDHAPTAECDSKFRYCTECLVSGKSLKRLEVREAVKDLGDSLIVAGSDRRMRLHMHTDDPGEVFDRVAAHGTLAQEKVDDMVRQRLSTERAAHKTIGLVTDGGCDLPTDFLDEHDVHVVPHRIEFEGRTYMPGVTLASKRFFERLTVSKSMPTSATPTPGDFKRAYEFVSRVYKNVISVNVSSGASATVQTARRVAKSVSDRIRVVDTKSASIGQGLVLQETVRAMRAGLSVDGIVAHADKCASRMKSLIAVDTLKYIIRGGRVSRLKGYVGQILGLKPFFMFDENGSIQIAGKVLRGGDVHEAMIDFVAELLEPMKRYRLGIAHGNDPDRGEWYRSRIEAVAKPVSTVYCELSPLMGVHGGQGSMGVALLPVETDAEAFGVSPS